jgi:O-antigen/teichoic acid export membrane protein
VVFQNSFWNVGSYFVGLLVLAVATPIYINLLGLDQFGILTLLATATAPLGILSAGVGQAVTKYVAEFKSAGEPDRAIRLVATTLCLNLVVGLSGFATLWLAADWVVQRVFKIPPELGAEARLSICLAGGVWFLMVISGTFQAVIVGLQNFRLLAIGNALQQILTHGAGIGVLYLSPRISSLLWWNLGVAGAIMFFWYSRAKTEFGGLSLLPKWDWESAGLSWRFSMWQILNSLVGIPANHVDRFLLVTMIGPAAVGIYGVALSVQSRVVGLVWSAVGTLFPAASAQLRNEGASERFILITGSMMSLVAGGGYAILCVLGPDLLCLWLGESVGRQSGPLLQVLMLAAILGLPSAVIYQYLLATGRTRISTLSNVATTAVTVVASFFWIREAGLRGAAWGGLLGLALTRPIFHWWVFRHCFQSVATTTECFRVLYVNLASVLSGLVLGFALHRWLSGALGLLPGILVSLVATPVLVYAAIVAVEASVMRRSAMVLQLCSEVWRKIGRRRPEP